MEINDLTISLLVLIGIRLIACIMFIILYLQNKKVKYLVLALGWLIYMVGPIPDLFSTANVTETLHPLFGFFAALGTYFLMLSVVLWFRDIPLKILILIISLVVLIFGIFITIKPDMSGFMAVFSQGIFLISLLVLVIVKSTFFKNNKNSVSFFWLCATLGFGLFHAFGFHYIFRNVPLSARFVLTFLINLSFFQYFIYFDWELSVKKLKESDERYRFLFNTAPVALFEEDSNNIRTNISGIKKQGVSNIRDYFESHPAEIKEMPRRLKILEANHQTLLLFQADSREELFENIDKVFIDDTYVAFAESMMGVDKSNSYSSNETVIHTLKGESREVLISCYYPERTNLDDKTIISMVDITEKNEAQKAIESSLREKEVLLQEVHHRVRNNLTIISSILGLQAESYEDEVAKEIIRSIGNRINTMAIVHEQLYRSGNLQEIDFSNYIRELVEGVNASFIALSGSVMVAYEMESIYLGVNILIPAGMLINEIITNSYKHAFEHIEKPEIHIKFQIDDGNGILSISDNGRGFSERCFNQNTETTGFMIIKALSHQLGANLALHLINGSEYIISFPLLMGKSGG